MPLNTLWISASSGNAVIVRTTRIPSVNKLEHSRNEPIRSSSTWSRSTEFSLYLSKYHFHSQKFDYSSRFNYCSAKYRMQ